MILVTGARGFIGNELIKQLGGKLRIISRKNIPLPRGDIEVLKGDLTNPKFVKVAVRGANTIIHMAAVINPNDQNIFDVNVDATKYLVEEAKKNKIKKFIYLSSGNVNSNYLDNYSKSKIQAEQIVRQLKNHVILRPPVIYGKGDKKYLGKAIKLIKKLPFIPLVGKGIFQPLYVKDLVKYIKIALTLPKIKGTYNLAGPKTVSFKEFLFLIQKIIKIKKPFILIPLWAIKPFVLIYQKISKNPFITLSQINNLNTKRIYNPSKNLKIFGFKLTPLEKGIKESITS